MKVFEEIYPDEKFVDLCDHALPNKNLAVYDIVY